MKVLSSIIGLIALLILVSPSLNAAENKPGDLEKGLDAFVSKKFAVAVHHFTKLIDEELKSHPESKAFVLFYRSRAYTMQQRFKMALRDINEAMRLSPKNPKLPYIYFRAIIQMKKNDINAASSDFDQAIKEYPHNFMVFVGRAELFALKKDFQRAIDDLSRAIELNDHNERLWGIMYFQLGTYQEKIGDIENATSSYHLANQHGYKSGQLKKKLLQYPN